MTLNRDTIEGLRTFQTIAWGISESKGFHLDEPAREDFADGDRGDAAFKTAVTNYNANRLMLIVGEASEAHEQLRNGRAADETYYPGSHPYVGSGSGFCARCDDMPGEGNHGPQKPEGIPSEIADVVIRCFDYAHANKIDLAGIIDEKMTYNTTRPFKHGKKF